MLAGVCALHHRPFLEESELILILFLLAEKGLLGLELLLLYFSQILLVLLC
jgi:hypothetical protein